MRNTFKYLAVILFRNIFVYQWLGAAFYLKAKELNGNTYSLLIP
jgi:hypothetical protein